MLAFRFALAFALIPGMSNQDATPTITLNPAPPTAGQTAEVGWTGTGPKTLQLTWDPAGAGPAEIVVPKGGTAKRPSRATRPAWSSTTRLSRSFIHKDSISSAIAFVEALP